MSSTPPNRTVARVARALASAEVLRVAATYDDPATWRRWRLHRTPITYDATRLALDPGSLEVVALAVQSAIGHRYPDVDLLVGIGPSGASITALVAHRLGRAHVLLDMSRTDHFGRDPDLSEGPRRALLIDHLMLSGATLESATKHVASWEGVTVHGALAVVSAGQRLATEASRRQGVQFAHLLDLEAVLTAFSAAGACTSQLANETSHFYRDPDNHDWLR